MVSGSRTPPPCRRRSIAPCAPSPSRSARRSSTLSAVAYRTQLIGSSYQVASAPSPPRKRGSRACLWPEQGVIGEVTCWVPAFAGMTNQYDRKPVSLERRGLGHLEALPRLHLLNPVLQFRVLRHWRAAFRHVAEMIEQRDHHQIGETDVSAGQEPVVLH